MATLRRTPAGPLQLSGQLRRLVAVALGVPVQLNADTLLTFYRDSTETGEVLRAELLHRGAHAENRHILPFWCYLPQGYAADLFPFAPLYVFTRHERFPVAGRETLLLEFVDFGTPVECPLNQIQVSA